MKSTFIALLIAGALGLAACNDTNKAGTAAEPKDISVVAATATLAESLKVAPLTSAPVSETLRVAGRIDLNAQRVTRIGATVTGRITDLTAVVGQQVRVGETLATLHSTELSTAQLGFLKARSQAELQARAVERARQLFAADVIGRAELQRRESELAVAQAEQHASEDQLRVLGVSPAAIKRLGSHGAVNSVSSVAATLAGTVVERPVAQGQVVQPADVMFVVADLSRVWVVAQVPEKQADLVRPGQNVEIEVPSLTSRVTGKLVFISDTLDPDTRTVTVRTEVDNTDRRLKPAMLATMLIESRPQERLVVPAEAVVRESDADHVFVKIGENLYRLTPVKLGPESGGQRPLVSGLPPDAQIVSAGAFHLNNERKRQEME